MLAFAPPRQFVEAMEIRQEVALDVLGGRLLVTLKVSRVDGSMDIGIRKLAYSSPNVRKTIL